MWQHFGGADYDPVCLYAATKKAFEDIIAFYVSARGLTATTLYLYDTYGPSDPRPKLFAVLRHTAETGDHMSMSAAEQTIDYVYIDDITNAFAMAAERLLAGEASGHERYEVRTGRPRPLRDVVETWLRVTRRTLDIGWGERPYRDREVMAPWTGGAELPGWHASVDLEEGIRRMEGLQT